MKRIKIIDTLYDPKLHIVVWSIHLIEENRQINLMYNANDIASSILKKDIVLNEEQVCQFNSIMKGKEIWWDSHLENGKLAKDMSKDEFNNYLDSLSKYPIPNLQIN